MRYFISDVHFFDEGIIFYCDRPFASVEEMHSALVENFRRKTSGGGEIYMLGDIMGMNGGAAQRDGCLELLKSMGLGTADMPFHLILGNHDTLPTDDYLSMGFASVERTGRIGIGGFSAMLTHDPCMAQPRNTLAICGHIHTLFDEIYNAERNTLTINVCVERRNYEPVSEKEILEIIKKSQYN